MTLEESIHHLENAVSAYDPRFSLKVLRNLPQLRKTLESQELANTIASYYTDAHARFLLELLENPKPSESAVNNAKSLIPEVDVFLHLLLQVWLLNSDLPNAPDRVYRLSLACLERIQVYNRRSLDYLVAKIWFYYLHSAELTNRLPSATASLFAGLRTATLRHDKETQGMIIVSLLRSHIVSNKVSQAANLVGKAPFPESCSNSLAARYNYYLSRISAIQLDYSRAHDHITSAIRKVPQTAAATGFLQTAYKLNVLIELLMGDIPDRTLFKKPEFAKSLAPYFALSQAVRKGDVAQFDHVLQENANKLKADANYTIAHRLRQNVIKTGIRVMSLTYSRISLKDICVKLHLDSEESAEYIVAKAVRDGVIDAEIDHVKGFMQSKELVDIYSTTEPQYVLHHRTKFCIDLHNDSVKAMHYSSNSHRKDLKDAEEARAREKELVSEIQEDTDLEDFDPAFDM